MNVRSTCQSFFALVSHHLYSHHSYWSRLGQVLVSASLCTGLVVTLPTAASWGQATLTNLNQSLEQAVAARQWDRAIQVIDLLMQQFPSQRSSLEAYRTQLRQLQSADQPSQGFAARASQATLPRGQVAIKRRSHGVIIIDATFNNRKNFEMLVDSGASLTVITRPMARQLGLDSPDNIVQVATFNTANGVTQFPIVYLRSIEVGGLTTRQLPVAIGGPDLEIGLLGQDFLQHYDVSIKRDRIEFHSRN